MRHHFHSHCHAPSEGRGWGEGFSRRAHFFRREGEREGHRARFFEQGDLRWVILALIAEKPAHGYEIIKAIEDRLGGAYAPSPGTVYPTLTLLEELGYIRVREAEGPRKLYEITPEGETALDQNRSVVDAILAKMAEIGLRRSGHQAPQLVRAWQNVKMAMNLRVARGPLSQAQIDGIAQILDTAAKAIENT